MRAAALRLGSLLLAALATACGGGGGDGAATIPEPPQAIVADVSFISLKQALPPALGLAARDAWDRVRQGMSE